MSSVFQAIVADFADDKVYIGGTCYPVGSFVVDLLNQSEDVHETTTDDLIAMEKLLFPAAGMAQAEDLLYIDIALGYLMKKFRPLLPFPHFFTEEQTKTIHSFLQNDEARQLFAAHNAAQKTSEEHPGEDLGFLHAEHPILDNGGFALAFDELEGTVRALCEFMCKLLDEVRRTYKELKLVADLYSYRGVHDETALLNLARTVPVDDVANSVWQYVDLPKDETKITVGKRYYFTNYREFIITDFFEGLHRNHYPRQCIICGKYFLVTNGRRKEICDGDSGVPIPHTNKTYTCRQLAKRQKQKEATDESPVKALYQQRLGGIRQDANRGNITKAFADCARGLAKERKLRALMDNDYATGAYLTDILKPQLYADVRMRMAVEGGASG